MHSTTGASWSFAAVVTQRPSGRSLQSASVWHGPPGFPPFTGAIVTFGHAYRGGAAGGGREAPHATTTKRTSTRRTLAL